MESFRKLCLCPRNQAMGVWVNPCGSSLNESSRASALGQERTQVARPTLVWVYSGVPTGI